MVEGVAEKDQDLLKDETRAYAYLATVMKDGSPQVTPVWFDVAGGLIRVNTAEGRTKCRNMKKRDRVALVIADPRDPFHYVQIRGRVESWTHDGARAHIDRLAGKYVGKSVYDGPADEQRITFLIRPDRGRGLR
jgi:PPOX class probable F420-dependent enzyme